jgi:hypothetical protein
MKETQVTQLNRFAFFLKKKKKLGYEQKESWNLITECFL